MKKKLIFIIASCLMVMASCSSLDDNLQNPNSPTPNQGNLDLVLTSAQLSFSSFYWDVSDIGSALTRMEIMFGPLYSNAFPATSYDAAWGDAYQGVLMNAKTVIDQGPAQKLYTHIGIARVLQAYTLMTLVDMFGAVPYSDAFQGLGNTIPSVAADGGKSVYASALVSLDSAILNFNKSGGSSASVTDVYYAGNKTKWLALANTLKLKYYMNSAMEDAAAKAAAVTAIQTLLAGDVIDKTDGSEDFAFNYGTSYTNPNSRHPKYNNNYTTTGSGDFFGTNFMYIATGAEKSIISGGTIDDPRRRIYFYRQNGDGISSISTDALPCGNRTAPTWYSGYSYFYASSGMPFCHLGNLGLATFAVGYWGRDHGDASGIPPDGQKRCTYGVYPAGGLYDNSTFATISKVDLGGLGKGIAPIWLASYTEFMKVEAALNLGVSLAGSQSAGTTAAAAFRLGVSNSVEKVNAFPATIGVTIPTTRQYTLDNKNGSGVSQGTYDAVNDVVTGTLITGSKAKYYDYTHDAFAAAPASGAGSQLDLAAREFYIAAIGNGIEVYNLYRRTGFPSGMQYKLAGATDSADPFVTSGYYPSVAVNRNSNISQKATVNEKVFWDNAGLTLQ